jgi:hypothetical protein
MIEHSCLSIGPWSSEGDAPPVRTVRAADTLEMLGIVRASRGQSRLWRRLWSSTEGLELCETADLALVMSIHPSRISRGVWIVRECDQNEVGRLRGDDLLDPWNQPFAFRQVDADGHWRLQEVGGRLYASGTALIAADDTIAFADPQISNPFLRMLVFASFLLLRPPRK